MNATTVSPPVPPRPAVRQPLPKGLHWSKRWLTDTGMPVDGLPGVQVPVDDEARIAGRLWACPTGVCEHTVWTFGADEPAPCCPKHPEILVPAPLSADDQDPVGGARSRVAAWAREAFARRRDRLTAATRARLDAAEQAAADAARRTAADMRGHVPSLVAAGTVLAGGPAVVVQAGPEYAAAIGAALVVHGAVAAYVVAYLAAKARAQARMRARGEVWDPRSRSARRVRARARHVAAGTLAAGGWLMVAAAAGVDPTTASGALTLLLGCLLAWTVNDAHWRDLWATRARLRDLARRNAEAAAARAAAELEALATAAPALAVEVDESDPAEVGRRMAARWAQLAELDTVPFGFQMRRTRVVPDETRPVTARNAEGQQVRIGWEYIVQADPGALVARPGMPSPFVGAREWLASVLEVDPATLSLVDRPDGQINRGLMMLTDTLPLGGIVEYKGRAGIRRNPDGSLFGHVGRTLLGDDAYRTLWIPGQAGGGGRYGVTGSGKALALGTPIPTPNGWTTMGALRVGDRVFDEAGQPCRVSFATETMIGHDCYELVFSDGSTIVADAEHQWVTSTFLGRVQAARRARRSVSAEVQRLLDQVADVMERPDSVTTVGDVVDEVGRRFRHPARVAAGSLAGAGQALNGRGGWAQTYSTHGLYSALAKLATTSRNASREVAHDAAPVTTAQIASTLRWNGTHANHAVATCGPLKYASVDLPIPPYVLGVWLGDGASSSGQFYTADQEVLDELAREGMVWKRIASPFAYSMRVAGVAGRQGQFGTVLRQMGVLGNKHVPDVYLRGSVDQRLALLQGLMDTDGYCTTSGTSEFSNTNERLARQVFDLAISLGFKATLRSKPCHGRSVESSIAYTVAFTTDVPVFRLPRKAGRQLAAANRATNSLRYIVDVRPVHSVPVRCIQVDSLSHMYLAGSACIPTHNTVVTQISLLNDLYAGIFSALWDGKNFMDFGEFIGVIPMGCTVEHRDVMRRSFWAEMQRRQQYLTMMEGRDRHGRLAPVEALWVPERDGPPTRWTIEEFHLNARDQQFITALTSLVRLQRSTAIMLEIATQGGGLADAGDSVLRDQLNQISMQIMRMGDASARLTGYRGDYMPSELPRIPGVMLMVEADAPAVPVRGAYVHRRDEDGSIYDHLFAASGEQILFPPALPAETVAVYEREGLMDLWRMGQGPGGKRRLLAESPEGRSGAVDPIPSDATSATPTLPAADVVLAIVHLNPGCSRATVDTSDAWMQAMAGGRVPVPSTISRAAAKLEKDGLLTRTDNRWQVTDKGQSHAELMAVALLAGGPARAEKLPVPDPVAPVVDMSEAAVERAVERQMETARMVAAQHAGSDR